MENQVWGELIASLSALLALTVNMGLLDVKKFPRLIVKSSQAEL